MTVIQRRGPAQELRATIDRLPLDVRQGVLDGIKGQRIIAGAHADAAGGVCPMVAADVRWKSVSASSVECAQQAARAWDRYAEATGSSHPATKRQLLALTSMLEASILQESSRTAMPLSDAIAEYQLGRSVRSAAHAPITHPSAVDEPVARPRYLGMRAAGPSSVKVPAAGPSSVGVPAPEHPTSLDMPAARPSSRERRNTGERDRTSEFRQRDGWAWLRPFRSYDEYEATLLRALAELDSHERQLVESQVR